MYLLYGKYTTKKYISQLIYNTQISLLIFV
nr:MAG TPA: hypothetical protein [Caudoviricetes sp.]